MLILRKSFVLGVKISIKLRKYTVVIQSMEVFEFLI